MSAATKIKHQKNYQILRTIDQCFDAFEYLKSRPAIVGFDIETNSADEQIAKVIGIAFNTDIDEGFYIPTRVFNPETQTLDDVFSYKDEQFVIKNLCKILLTKDLIMHNGVFDIVVMKNFYEVDLTPALFADTILMKHTIDENRPFGLKDIAVKFQRNIGIPKNDVANQEQLELKESVIKNGGKWTIKQKDIYKGDLDIIAKYACADVDLTLRIFDYFQFELEDQNLEEFFYNQEVMPLYLNGTIPMKMGGVFIDVLYFEKLKKELEDDILKSTVEIFDELRPNIEMKVRDILDQKIKVSATGEFAKRALQYYDIPIPVNKRTGKPTLAKSFLHSLEANFPDLPIIDFLLKGTALPTDDVYAIKRLMFIERYPQLPEVFNLASNDHLAWLLFEHFGCEPKEFSRKTKKPKVDKNALEDYGHLPFILKLAKLKKTEKLLASYVLPILTKNHNGWLYPSMLQFGTTSGRYACAGGLNLQTLPRGDKRIKQGFIAPPGYKVVNADFSALEPRIFSWVCGDKGLKRVWQEGLDLYSQIAIDVFGLEDVSSDPEADNYLKKVNPDMRDRAKVFTLAVVYGANEYRIAKLMGVEPQEAKDIINRYLDAYPGLEEYMEFQDQEAYTKGQVKTKFGRVRRLPEAKRLHRVFGRRIFNKQLLMQEHQKDFANEIYYKFRNLMNNAKNFPIQATAAHVTNAALIKIGKLLKENNIDGWIALQVHDEITLIVKEKQAQFASRLLKEAMEHNDITAQIDIPILAEPMIADNFAEAK